MWQAIHWVTLNCTAPGMS